MHPSTIPSPRLDPDERVLSWSMLKKSQWGKETHKEGNEEGEERKEGRKERKRGELVLVCATYLSCPMPSMLCLRCACACCAAAAATKYQR